MLAILETASFPLSVHSLPVLPSLILQVFLGTESCVFDKRIVWKHTAAAAAEEEVHCGKGCELNIGGMQGG